MKSTIVSCAVAFALFASGVALADNGGRAATSAPGTGSAAQASAANGTPDTTVTTASTSADDPQMKACLVRKRSGDHSMSLTDRERACRAEAVENATQPVASMPAR